MWINIRALHLIADIDNRACFMAYLKSTNTTWTKYWVAYRLHLQELLGHGNACHAGPIFVLVNARGGLDLCC